MKAKTIDNPEQVAMCLNCVRPSCQYGKCDDVAALHGPSKPFIKTVPHDDITDLARAGKTVEELSRHYGVTMRTVRRWLQDAQQGG